MAPCSSAANSLSSGVSAQFRRSPSAAGARSRSPFFPQVCAFVLALPQRALSPLAFYPGSASSLALDPAGALCRLPLAPGRARLPLALYPAGARSPVALHPAGVLSSLAPYPAGVLFVASPSFVACPWPSWGAFAACPCRAGRVWSRFYPAACFRRSPLRCARSTLTYQAHDSAGFPRPRRGAPAGFAPRRGAALASRAGRATRTARSGPVPRALGAARPCSGSRAASCELARRSRPGARQRCAAHAGARVEARSDPAGWWRLRARPGVRDAPVETRAG